MTERLRWGNAALTVEIGWAHDVAPHLTGLRVGTTDLELPPGRPLVEVLTVRDGHAPATDRLVQTAVGRRARYVDHRESVVAGGRELVLSVADPVSGLRAELLLELPLRFAREFNVDLEIEKIDEERDVAIARLSPTGRVRFGPVLIGAGAVSRFRFLVRPEDPSQRGRIIARQLWGKSEVGRVTWVLAPGVRDRKKLAADGDPIGALD